MADEYLVLLDPTAEPAPRTQALAPRPDALSGRRLALLDNAKSNAGRLLDLIADELRAETPDLEIVRLRKPETMTPAAPALIEQLVQEAQLAITAIGD
jgi:hypothetical protein